MFVIETFLAYRTRECLLANLYLHVCAQGSMLAVDEGETYTLVGGDGVIAGSDFADDIAVFQYAVAMARYRLVMQARCPPVSC